MNENQVRREKLKNYGGFDAAYFNIVRTGSFRQRFAILGWWVRSTSSRLTSRAGGVLINELVDTLGDLIDFLS